MPGREPFSPELQQGEPWRRAGGLEPMRRGSVGLSNGRRDVQDLEMSLFGGTSATTVKRSGSIWDPAAISRFDQSAQRAERQAQMLQYQPHALVEPLAVEHAALAKEAESLPLSSTWGFWTTADEESNGNPAGRRNEEKRIAAQQAQASATANQLSPPQRAYASSAAKAAQKASQFSSFAYDFAHVECNARHPPNELVQFQDPLYWSETFNKGASQANYPVLYPTSSSPSVTKKATPRSIEKLDCQWFVLPSTAAAVDLILQWTASFQMLLDFPLDPASYHLELIFGQCLREPNVIRGRVFASDFVTKRKADARARIPKGSSIAGNTNNGKTTGTIAGALKGVPRKSSQEWNVNAKFKVVTPKQKKGKR
ncbi:hypothetical protein BT69DRAFT_1349350 [Atractiella rhizophila]|nr:hypothetical protein BT69DRAFT_1349350 [Atractiella rhizophila]